MLKAQTKGPTPAMYNFIGTGFFKTVKVPFFATAEQVAKLDAIASCYIGGAAAAGGVGTITGAVVGAFVMGVLNNGMSLIGWSTDIQKVAKGAVLLGAVLFDMVSKRKKA